MTALVSREKKYAIAIATLCLLIAALLFSLDRYSRNQLRHQVYLRQQALTNQCAARISAPLHQLSAGMHYLGRHASLEDHSPPDAERQLALLYHSLPESSLTCLLLLDAEGRRLIEYPPGKLAPESFPLPLPNSLEDRHSGLQASVLHKGRSLLLYQDTRFRNAPARLVAMVPLSLLVAESIEPISDEAEFCFILDDKGNFQLHCRPELVGRSYAEILPANTHDAVLRKLSAFTRGDYGHIKTDLLSLPEILLAKASSAWERPHLLTGAPVQVAGSRWTLALDLPATGMAAIEAGTDLLPIVLTLLLFGSLLIVPQASRLLQTPGQLTRERRLWLAENTHLREQLALTVRRYGNLLNNAGDAIFFIDPAKGSLLEVNRQAEEMLGYQAEEIRRLDPSILFPGRNYRRYLRLVARVLRHGYGEESALVFRCKNGHQFTGAVHARLGDLGEERVVHGVLRDVSEILRIEQELRQKNRDLLLLNQIADHTTASRDLQEMLYPILAKIADSLGLSGGGIYILEEGAQTLRLIASQGIGVDLRQEIEVLPLGEGLIGRVAMTGRPKTSLNLEDDQRVYSEAVRRAGWRGFQAVPLATGDRPVGVLFLFCQSKRILCRSETNLLEAIGKQVGTAVAGINLLTALQRQVRLTKASNKDLEQSRRQLRDSLVHMEEANRALAQLDRMKSNFLALASHELRTPLTYILSGTEILVAQLKERLSEGDARALEAVHEGGKRLQTIVEDLLEVARIESRSLYLARERIDLAPLLAELAQEFAPVFQERSLQFHLHELPSASGLFGDNFHLRRTFARLLENAIKFTPEGGSVEILSTLVTPADLQAQENRLRPFSPSFFAPLPSDPVLQVSICDSGVGIDKEDHVRIFDKFYEIGDIAGHSTSRTRFGGKGVGLGLTLVKGMVEAHGGMVWVESAGTEAGTGSAFHVLLPLTGDRGITNGDR